MQAGAMTVVDVNAGTDEELLLALSEAGIKLKVVWERISSSAASSRSIESLPTASTLSTQ